MQDPIVIDNVFTKYFVNIGQSFSELNISSVMPLLSYTINENVNEIVINAELLRGR